MGLRESSSASVRHAPPSAARISTSRARPSPAKIRPACTQTAGSHERNRSRTASSWPGSWEPRSTTSMAYAAVPLSRLERCFTASEANGATFSSSATVQRRSPTISESPPSFSFKASGAYPSLRRSSSRSYPPVSRKRSGFLSSCSISSLTGSMPPRSLSLLPDSKSPLRPPRVSSRSPAAGPGRSNPRSTRRSARATSRSRCRRALRSARDS